MREEHTNIEKDVVYQRQCIDALLSITEPGDEFPSIEKLFQKAIGIIQEITGFSTVTVRIYNPEDKTFRIMAQAGMTPEMIEKLYFVSEEMPIFAEIMDKKEPAFKVPLKFIQDLGYKKTFFVPLVAGDIVMGSIDLPTKTDYIPSDDEFRWFALVGRMLGSMIYQAQLTERLQSMAVIQERTRLANELHDDVAQLVRSMSWGLEEARLTLNGKQYDKTDGILENLEIMVQNTSAYLREEMLSLRERFDSSAGIFPVLEGMLSRFERNWGIKTSLVTESSDPASYNKFMSSNAEIQLIRIIQEALMNIRRHAEAETVTLKVSEDLDRMIYTIVDDGVGFRLEEIPQESLGLRVIRERASSIEAKVRIDSIEGVGTTLELQIPSHVGEAA